MSGRVADWLEQLGLDRYAEAFAVNAIEWAHLPDLDHETLQAVGVDAVGHRMTILKAAAALAPSIAPAGTVSTKGFAASADRTHVGAAERRQLTVMFCDLIGSTELSQLLDPEDLREVNRAYQDACKTAIEEYDGYVARYMGDGVLAYFGYPQAHEDDAERSIHAGLGVVGSVAELNATIGDRQGVTLGVRVGIATGPVVVGDLIGEGASQENAVVGETPNLAARLQAMAKPNRILIAPATRRLAGGQFEYDDLGPQLLKGIEQPVCAWAILGERNRESRFEAARGERLAPLIGRDEERDILLRRWRRTVDGVGQMVLVSGEAGIGKSRLVRGLRESLADQSYTVLSYQCSPYHVSSGLYPIISQLERAAGFLRGDTPDSKLDKLEGLLARSTEQVEQAVPLLAALLSLPGELRYGAIGLTPAQQKDRTLAVLVEQLEGLATQRPVLAVFEDVHWVDPTTLELLDLIINRILGSRVLVLLTHRPDFAPTWTGEAHVTSIGLNKLDSVNCSALAGAVTGGRALPDEVLDEIVEKTDGVPLFVEELTKMVIESGMLRTEDDRYVLDQPLPALAIPTTLQDSLMARLDRLAAVKDIAQTGAVIGREFGHELLEAVAGLSPTELTDSLQKLAEAGLVFRRGTPPQASYLFKHALIQDTAYASLLRSRRQQLHAKIATVLETSFPTLVASQPELVAHHLHSAGLTTRAIDYWRKAAAQAASRSTMQEAYSHLGVALAAQRELPQTDVNQRLRLDLLVERITPIIAVKSYSSPELVELYDDAMSVHRAIGGSNPQLFPIIYARWVFHFTSGQMQEALERAHEFLAIAERQGARLSVIMGWRLCGTVMVVNRATKEGGRYLQQVVEELDEGRSDEIGFIYGQDTLAGASCYHAFALCALGQLDQARQRIEFALERAAGLDNALTIGYVNGHLGLLFAEIGDDVGLARCVAAMECTLSEHPMPVWSAALSYLQGMKAFAESRNDAAAVLIEECLAAMKGMGFFFWQPIFKAARARVQLAQGRLEEARDSVSGALEEIDRGRDAWIEPELYRIRGAILAARGRPGAEIEACYREALTKARAHPNRLYELRAALSLARYWRDQGNRREVREMLAPVYEGFTEGFDTPDMKETSALLEAIS